MKQILHRSGVFSITPKTRKTPAGYTAYIVLRKKKDVWLRVGSAKYYETRQEAVEAGIKWAYELVNKSLRMEYGILVNPF